MEKYDRFFAWLVGVTTAILAVKFNLDYGRIVAHGLTLSSIVLAVYVAAIIGLINSDLAKKMQKTAAQNKTDKSQLGVLTTYFKMAAFFSILTIIVSSLLLLIPQPDFTEALQYQCWKFLSVVGLVSYTENLLFLIITIRFMLNRQIWNN